MIIITALIPTYLWCSSNDLGLPILPIAALTFLPTHAFPLLNEHRQIRSYSDLSQFIAAGTVAGFLILATASWYFTVTRLKVNPGSYIAFGENPRSYTVLWTALTLFAAFTIADPAGWINLDGGTFAIVRAITGSTGIFSLFALYYRWGQGKLDSKSKLYLVILSGFILTSSIVGLLLYRGAAYFLTANIGYFLGSRRLPIKTLAVGLALFSFLQLGKAAMRGAHSDRLVQPWDYPAWFSEWAELSLQPLISSKAEGEKQEDSATISDRTGLIHLLLLTQSQTPENRPFLLGYTYEPVPELLVPRIFDPGKIWANEGTFRLNIYYGKQTRDSVYKTTIGWGLLAEAYANFGFVGCGMLGCILGSFYGWTASWARNTPLLSARSLFSILILLSTLTTEYCATSYISTLFQSSASLWLFSVLLMEKFQPDKRQVSTMSPSGVL